MATQEQVAAMISLSDGVMKTPIDALVSNPNWGTINFDSARADLELIFDLCSHLKVLPLALLPNSIADGIVASITQTGQLIEQMRTFKIENANPTALRDQIVTQAKQFAEHLLLNTQTWIPFLAYQKGDVQRNINALSQSVIDAAAILETSKIEIDKRKEEIASIVTAAREASASAGVGVFTSDFDSRATALDRNAGRWLNATAALAIVTLVAACLSYFVPLASDATNAQIFQHMTTKLVVLLVLITATVWCGRIYKALKHQAAVTGHRANALKTFQAFVKASSDDNTRDAVLLETTRSIFALSPSGYLETNDGTSDTPTKVMEIFKGAGIGSKA